MSNISSIVTALRTNIPLLSRYSAKSELSNSIDISRNSDHILEAGWGVRVDSSSNGALGIMNFLNEAREFSVVTTRKSFHKKSDVDSFMSDQVALMEDHAELIKYLLADSQLGIPNIISKVDFVSNSGVELVDGKEKFIQTVTTISIDILEQTGCL